MKEEDYKAMVEEQAERHETLFKELAAEVPDWDINDPVYFSVVDVEGFGRQFLMIEYPDDMPDVPRMKDITFLFFQFKLTQGGEIEFNDGNPEAAALKEKGSKPVVAGKPYAGMILMGGYEKSPEPPHERTGAEIVILNFEDDEYHSGSVMWKYEKIDGVAKISNRQIVFTETTPEHCGAMQNFFRLPPKPEKEVVN